MLKQRIITAALLLAVFLPALVFPSPWFFAALTLVLIGAAGWEWARMQGALAAMSVASGVAAALTLSALMWGGLDVPWGLVWLFAAAAWVLLSVWMLARGVSAWLEWPQGMRHGFGLALIVLAGAALWQARLQGWVFLLSILVLVWTAWSPWSSAARASKTPADCCRAMAASSTGWMRCCPCCPWP